MSVILWVCYTLMFTGQRVAGQGRKKAPGGTDSMTASLARMYEGPHALLYPPL